MSKKFFESTSHNKEQEGEKPQSALPQSPRKRQRKPASFGTTFLMLIPYLLVMAVGIGGYIGGSHLYNDKLTACEAPTGYASFSGEATNPADGKIEVIRSYYPDGKGTGGNIVEQIFAPCGTPDGRLKTVQNYLVNRSDGTSITLSKAVINVIADGSPLAAVPQTGK